MADFARKYAPHYAFRDRELAGAFEIGCFLTLVADYERQRLSVIPRNLDGDEFKYLTTPNGNPQNFSYVELQSTRGGLWQLRQQVRVRSHLHNDITFTPDIVLLDADAAINEEKDIDYAGGKRTFFSVTSTAVIAAHECKSMTGFPELYISFVGMLVAAHDWVPNADTKVATPIQKGHLAPTLFVGGEASNLHRKMIAALQQVYPMNIITGLHRGSWKILKQAKQFRRLIFNPSTAKSKIPLILARSKPRAILLPSSPRVANLAKVDEDSDIPF